MQYKASGAKLDYSIDYTDWLDGDTIATSAWDIPDGITTSGEANTTTAVTIWASGGTEGETYELENTITTASGRIEVRSIFIGIISPELGEHVARVRRLVNEADETTYTDSALIALLLKYAVTDTRGEYPKYIQQFNSNEAPTYAVNPYWTPTYDVHAVAADVWEEKATAPASNFDFSADGASYKRSQKFEQFMKLARYHRARRVPGTIDLSSWRGIPTDETVINRAE